MIKENYNKILKINGENHKLNEEIKSEHDKNYGEWDQALIEKNNKKIELNNIKIAILKNNIYYIIDQEFKNLQNKYENIFLNKAIGEKTKEKIAAEIGEHFKNKYNMNIKCYTYIEHYTFGYYLYIDFNFLNDEGYTSYIFLYKESPKICIYKSKSRSEEATDWRIEFSREEHQIKKYISFAELNKEATGLYNKYKKAVEKIENYKNSIKNEVEKIEEIRSGRLADLLKTESTLYIY